MDASDVIEIFSSEDEGEPDIDRRAILQPVVSRVVDALGGHEGGVYRMGDEVNGCLKDLKKLWRKDDTDDERTVARIFWETRVLPNDLIPILLETAGKGLVEDKRAIACADLMTAMTWPIDMAEELKELDDELDKGTDYTQLMESHLHYKVALLKPGVMQALFGIVLPPLSKSPKERHERDGQIINVVLHLVRNLAFIKDLPFDARLSANQAEFSSLQTKLVRALSETHMLQLLLTIAANTAKDPLLTNWNTLILEIFYLLFRGVTPSNLTTDQVKQPTATLQGLLAAEERTRKELSRKVNSRHSRFGTTIAVKLNPNKKTRPAGETDNGNEADSELAPSSSRSFVLHRQQAISSESGSIMDISKRQTAKKGNRIDEMTREDHLSVEARVILQNLAIEFTEACFNPFLSALLKDIRSERAKITEKDNLRLLFVTKWFLEFFLAMRAKEKDQGTGGRWGFALIAEVTERTWIIWVLKRMREAVEEKPKLWTELQTGIECLTQLLLLIDAMSSTDIADPVLKEAADVLQQQLIYNGEVLDIALESLRSYKPGTQSLVYLDSSIHLAYALLKMLEKWSKSKSGDVYVRKRKAKKRRGAKGQSSNGHYSPKLALTFEIGLGEEDGVPEEEEAPEEEEVVNETMFSFEAFEMKFAHADITHTLLTYLARYKDFSSSENMRRVVSTLNLFKAILVDQKSFPRDQPYKDLVNLITFILRQFFKALGEDTFLAVEAFFPKNRGHWKQFSSWEPEKSGRKEKKTVEDTKFPPDVEVKKGYSWSDQLGITIASLVEAGETVLVQWTKEILTVVIANRENIIDEIDSHDGTVSQDDEEDEAAKALKLNGPSSEAMSRITDYLIPYLSDEQADAASKHPHLKLLFRLCKFFILDEVGAFEIDAAELEWYVPAGIAPSDLRSTLTVIDQFLANPIDLGGKKASELFGKQRRRRRRRRSPSPESGDDAVLDDDEPRRRKKKEKKTKEKEQYKSAQFIEDSDEEYGDIEAFLEKEKAMREKAQEAAAASSGLRTGNMKSQGTKKRRRKTENDSQNKRRRSDQATNATNLSNSDGDMAESNNHDVGVIDEPRGPSSPSPPRPRPRPLHKRTPSTPSADSTNQQASDNDDVVIIPSTPPSVLVSRRNRLVISDDDDD
ncbi:hypothetical protein DXG01_015378 [Tephrocybe rancida]|nr:hypothetical protein DXG01_015378 [Tephrocybe rancida]